jgi:hypothetical protein
VTYHRLQKFYGFGVQRVIGQVIGVEVGSDGLEIRYTSRVDSGFVPSATELKVFLTTFLSLFYN